jgi:predicted NUDIX family NTP pyrophosphohydrolase
MRKRSAGLLVYRLKEGQPEVLIAHMGGPFHAKKDAGHWSIPKGEFDEGDDPMATARREFTEELDKPVPEGEWQDLGSITYKKNGKEVLVWAVEGDLDVSHIKSNTFKLEWPPRSGNVQEFPEIDRADWFSLPEAAGKLIPEQVEFLGRLANELHVPFGAEQAPPPPQQNSLF